MKKGIIVLVVIFVFFASRLFSQLEIKTNPPAMLFEIFPVSIEYVIQDHHGAELIFTGTTEEGNAFFGSYKYYFSPKFGGDRFYTGAFFGTINSWGTGLGFHVGYKLLAESGIIFEAGGGIGRTFEDGIELPMGQLSIGYRINLKKK